MKSLNKFANSLRFLLSTGLWVLGFLVVQAQSTSRIPFQGLLYEDGTPVNDVVTLSFSISDPEWSETIEGVQVTQGLYSVVLGESSDFPDDLFLNGIPELKVEIGGTEVASVPLYAPYMSEGLVAQNLPTRVSIDEATVPNDTAIAYSFNSDDYARGIQVDMTGNGLKFGIRSNVFSGAGDDALKVPLISLATGEGSGNHTGVLGQAFSTAKFNTGVSGVAGGTGSGETGFGEGSYNVGMLGVGQSNAWGNIGAEGRAVGTTGVDNIGVLGFSVIGEENDTSVENKGVLGRAEGPGINRAIMGIAENGVENWAGWFEGDVHVGGQQSFTANVGDINMGNNSNWNQDQLNFGGGLDGEDNQIGYGGASVGRKSWEGNPYLGYAHINARNENGDFSNVIRLEGQSDGSRDWGNIQVNGSVLEDDGNGNFFLPALINLDIELDQAGNEMGVITLRKSDGTETGFSAEGIGDLGQNVNGVDGKFSVSLVNDTENNDPSGFSAEMFLQGNSTPNFQMGGKPWENNDLAFLSMYGRTTDGNGWYHSNLNLNVASDGTDDWSEVSLSRSNIAGETNEETISLSGQGGNIWAAGNISNPRVDVQQDWGADGQGAVIVKDPNDTWMVATSANDDGSSNYYGSVIAYNSQDNYQVEINGSGFIGMRDNDTGTTYIDITNAGDIYASNSVSTDGDMNAVNFNTTSDRRFKDNIQPIESALAKTNILNGYTYNWNKLAKKKKGLSSDQEQIGVLAQELEAVFPQLVKTDEEGFKSVNYAALSAVLIEAVKELTSEVNGLKKENTQLKAKVSKVEELESKVNLIEQLLTKGNTNDLKTASK